MYLPFLMYHLGDSGQKYTPAQSGTAGINAEPNWSLHEIAPVSFTARLAQVPKKIPNAVHICQHITRPPRTEAGAFSAQKIGTVEAFEPMPMPRRKRVRRSSHQFCVTAEPITERQQNMAEKKMVPRLPK